MTILWLGQEEGKDKECAEHGYFPGGPVVKTSPSNEQGVSLIPGQGAKIHMPQGQKTKTCKTEAMMGQTQQRL